MFTGIVTQRALVAGVEPVAGSAAGAIRLSLRLATPIPGAVLGDSIALDGCCLTVVALDGTAVAFEAIPETLRKTTLGARRPGDRVNVEPALKTGDALGGHLVQGHVDGVGVVRAIETAGGDVRMSIDLPPVLHGAVIAKGSVTVDGVSLTVGECDDRSFSVYLIPHTLAVTGLGEKRVGESVNLEADVIGRYVEHHVRRVLAALGRTAPTAEEVGR